MRRASISRAVFPHESVAPGNGVFFEKESVALDHDNLSAKSVILGRSALLDKESVSLENEIFLEAECLASEWAENPVWRAAGLEAGRTGLEAKTAALEAGRAVGVGRWGHDCPNLSYCGRRSRCGQCL